MSSFCTSEITAKSNIRNSDQKQGFGSAQPRHNTDPCSIVLQSPQVSHEIEISEFFHCAANVTHSWQLRQDSTHQTPHPAVSLLALWLPEWKSPRSDLHIHHLHPHPCLLLGRRSGGMGIFFLHRGKKLLFQWEKNQNGMRWAVCFFCVFNYYSYL